MPKVLDPNHLQLMSAVSDSVQKLRETYEELKLLRNSTCVSVPWVRNKLNYLMEENEMTVNRLRLALKGRGQA